MALFPSRTCEILWRLGAGAMAAIVRIVSKLGEGLVHPI